MSEVKRALGPGASGELPKPAKPEPKKKLSLSDVTKVADDKDAE